MTSRFLSTNARVLINDWQAIRRLGKTHVTPVKKKASSTEEPSFTTALSDRELKDMLEGPHQTFFKEKLSAYATLGKLRLALTGVQEDDKNKKISTDNPALDRILTTTSINDLNKVQNDLDTLVKEHDTQWREHLVQWDRLLISACTENNIPLTEMEQTELCDKEPISELLNRFIDLNLTLPELNPDAGNYTQYLKLKFELVLINSLSRRQKPHTPHDISATIKSFSKTFKTIKQQETQLIRKQKEETRQLLIVAGIPISRSRGQTAG